MTRAHLKAKAYSAYVKALNSGELVRPRFCERCDAQTERGLHGHHRDYTRPLDVRWLCPACHGLAHREERLHDTHVATCLRLPVSVIARIDEYRRHIHATTTDKLLTRTDVMVIAIEEFLVAVGRTASPKEQIQ
jgi:hypothetical protein